MEPTSADKAALNHLSAAEPEYLRQSGDPMTEAGQTAWFQGARQEAEAEGVTHLRYSVHPYIPNLRLVEGWAERPANERVPRWQFQAG